MGAKSEFPAYSSDINFLIEPGTKTRAGQFDPVTNTFISVGSTATARSLHTSTLLTDERVLVAGGDTSFYNGAQAQSLSEAEVFDPSSETFTVTTNMTTPRESHTATLLNAGDVLVIGDSNGINGYSDTATTLDAAELCQ